MMENGINPSDGDGNAYPTRLPLGQRILGTLKTGVTIIKALSARLLFITHGALVAWRLMDIIEENWAWLLLALTGLLIIFETGITVFYRRGVENKWFSVCTFLFLCAVVPGLWLLEFDRLDRYKAATDNSTLQKAAESLPEIQGVTLPVTLDPDLWVLALEQMLLFILIIARWILPKGGISRSQLSLLLLVYVGMASDIMDIFVLFEEPEVLDDWILGYIILGVWSLSLLQFCLVLTVTKARRPRAAFTRPDATKNKTLCCETEIWSILTTVFMQDGPFLAVRLWIMIKYKTLNYSLLFFSFKNALVIILQIYRLVIVVSGADEDDDDDDDDTQKND